MPYNRARFMAHDGNKPPASPSIDQLDDGALADPDWLREPTRREHMIGAGLFVSFGVFFTVWFAFQHGWWFRWVVLALGVISILRGLKHMVRAVGVRSSDTGAGQK